MGLLSRAPQHTKSDRCQNQFNQIWAETRPLPLATKPFAPDDEAALREALKRCSPSTFEAAVQFRKTGNADHMPAVVIGVIERFVEPDLRPEAEGCGRRPAPHRGPRHRFPDHDGDRDPG